MRIFWFVLTAVLLSAVGSAQTVSYQYIRLGNPNDVRTAVTPAVAMMGGGADLDDAFRWLCVKGHGGDFLILRATGDDDYNPYIKGLCKLNSVATLILPDRASAQEPQVAEIIRQAEVLFIAGGDQANYIRGWKDTPVEDAINADIAESKPIGGTSAGLAVLGEYIYSAEGDAPDDPSLTSGEALANPYLARVALQRDFLRITLLRNTLTDSHFAKRNRMGRTLTFLARIVQDGWSASPREIAIDERSAVLLDEAGTARVIGSGRGAYFLSVGAAPETCHENAPLTFRNVAAYHGPSGSTFNVKDWTGNGGVAYSLSIVKGELQSTKPDRQPY
jgi:cyanophycinase